jgi:hypothetical protein
MPTIKRKMSFFETPEGVEVEEALARMVQDTAYNTKSSYSANTVLYPDNCLSFIDKHKTYLVAHPAIDPGLYLSNLRLMTRLR